LSTYILMKILESVPSRYDCGISILTMGKLDEVYDRLTTHIKQGDRVLDIGCGTGLLMLKAAFKGAMVKGIDINSRMLEIAKKRVVEANLSRTVELSEMGVAELDREKSNYYDAILSGLCFSELTENELIYTLKEVKRILKPEGRLLIADEVRPKVIFKRILNGLIRFPLMIITYLFTQTTTHAVKDLPDKIRLAGLKLESIQLNNWENFMELTARKTRGRKK
jgi:ubiquinone/menaquinone biosynthesis C-methylase UbiE